MASRDDPTLTDAEEAFERGDVETALAICEGLLGENEAAAPVEVLYLAAECLLEVQEAREAQHLVDLALSQAPGDPVLLHARGLCLFELCKLDAARSCFEQAVAGDDDLGEPRFYLGILAEHAGDSDAAARLFEEAVERDPENLVLPRTWTQQEVAEVFDAIIDELPDPLGIWFARLSLAYEQLPAAELLANDDDPISPLVLCLFRGDRPQHSESDGPDEWLQAQPERCSIFLRNLGKSAQDEYELHYELVEALLWEFMGFLDLDTTDMAALGLPTEVDDVDLGPGS